MAKKKEPKQPIEDAEVVEDSAVDAVDPDTGDESASDTAQASEEAEKTADAEPETPIDDYEFADPIIDTPQSAPVEPIEEAAGTSLSARVLQVLVLIFIGIAIALWGAPKLAPMLPAGLSPVAEFLAPGRSAAEAEVAALRAEMDEKLAAVSANGSGVDQAAIDSAIAAYDAGVAAQIGEIKDQLAATDGQDIEARIAALETKLEGMAAELTAVSDRLSRQITENGVALSEEAGAKLSGYQAALEGLRAEVGDLAAKNGALSQKVEEIASAAQRRVQEAQVEASNRVATTATRKLLTEIESALATGAAFEAALAGLEETTGAPAPDALAAVAATGTPSWTTLRNQFADKAHAALRADADANSGDGIGSKLGSFLRNQIGTRSLERREGDDVDAILSRVEDDLSNRRLDAALTEAASLPDAARAPMETWIAQLGALNAAQKALQSLASGQAPTE
ncbi:MAG: hypothetical protein AAF393_09810 [Pseudomonadota bacterium]